MATVQKTTARVRREQLGLSREKLGHKAGVSGSLIYQMESGYRPGPEVAQRLADALGLTVEQLHEQETR